MRDLSRHSSVMLPNFALKTQGCSPVSYNILQRREGRFSDNIRHLNYAPGDTVHVYHYPSLFRRSLRRVRAAGPS